METVAFCEAEPYARSVLARHWPGVPIYDDVRTLAAGRLEADGIGPIDLICGGFPCQDVSVAGKGRGLEDGTRTGLWSEYARLVGELRPRWVLAENVPGLRGRGADRVLSDLETLGYSARALVVGAVHAGAPHERRRVWILADAHGGRLVAPGARSLRRLHGHAASDREVPATPRRGRELAERTDAAAAPDAAVGRTALGHDPGYRWDRPGRHPKPSIRRVPDGLSVAAHRIRCLGNAVVPQVVEMLGRAILRVESELNAGTLAA